MFLLFKKFSFTFISIPVLLAISSCLTPRMVRPLEKGQKALRADVGYIIEDSISRGVKHKFIGALTYAKGISDNTTGYFTVRANYFPWPTLEGGLLHTFVKPENGFPGISSSFTLSGVPIIGERPFIFPMFQVAPNLYWETERDKHLFYIGSTAWFWGKIRYSPHFGSSFTVNKFNYNFELKYIPKETEYNLAAFFNQSYGIYAGMTRKF